MTLIKAICYNFKVKYREKILTTQQLRETVMFHINFYVEGKLKGFSTELYHWCKKKIVKITLTFKLRTAQKIFVLKVFPFPVKTQTFPF